MAIGRIRAIEFHLDEDAETWFACFKAPIVKTDAQWWRGRWMNDVLYLNNAQIRRKLQMPCECSSFNSCKSSRILQSLLQQIFNTSCRWWLAQEQAKGMVKFDGKVKKSLREFERIWDENEFGSEIVKCWCRILLWLTLYTSC